MAKRKYNPLEWIHNNPARSGLFPSSLSFIVSERIAKYAIVIYTTIGQIWPHCDINGREPDSSDWMRRNFIGSLRDSQPALVGILDKLDLS